MGIEAISRGAQFVTFVDCSRKNLRKVAEFLERVGVGDRGETILGYLPRDLTRIPLVRERPYDLIFADPPFLWDHSPLEILDAFPFLRLTHPETLMIWESRFPSPEIPTQFWEKVDERRYGRILLRFFMRKRELP
jgi:16S rRNA (guanine966-N2)-methyltransferase